MTANLRALVLALFPILGALGCSGSNTGEGQASQEAALRQVGEMLGAATQVKGKAPSKLSDLNSLQSVYSRGYQAVKSGDVVVVWGVGVKGETELSEGGEIVAYEKDAPTNGGFVLLTGGSVKRMSADEFNAAPKAK